MSDDANLPERAQTRALAWTIGVYRIRLPDTAMIHRDGCAVVELIKSKCRCS